MKEIIVIEDIPILLERKNIKHMYLKVLPPNGEVKITASFKISDDEVANFVKSKKDWILNKQKLILTNDIKAPLNMSPVKNINYGEKNLN